MAQNSNSIPIRVIPGNTELVKDTSTGAFHLNVGFHLSFNVKELMQALAKMTDVDVTIKAESSVPISRQQSAQTMQQPAQKEKEPPQKKNDEKLMGLGGPLKTTEPNQKIVDDSMTWETKLIKLSPATQKFRERKESTYQKNLATFFRINAPEPATEQSPASNGDGTASKEDKEEAIEDQEEKEKSKEAMEKEMGQDCNTQ